MAFRRAEAIALGSVLLTIIAVAPLYVIVLQRTPGYAVEFTCDPVTPQSVAARLETVEAGSFLGISTTCVLANLDSSTITANNMLATAATFGEGPLLAFDPGVFAEQLRRFPHIEDDRFPARLNPFDALTFVGVYALPMPAGWDRGDSACAALVAAKAQPLKETALCLRALSVDELRGYVMGLRTPRDGHEGYSQFAIQVRFDNGEAEVFPLALHPIYDHSTDPGAGPSGRETQ